MYQKAGEYRISSTPLPSATGTDTYSGSVRSDIYQSPVYDGAKHQLKSEGNVNGRG